MGDKMDKELPKRKHPRLKKYDYSSAGAYFITICIDGRKCLLSRIKNFNDASVGRGLAPAVTKGIEYTKYGQIAEEQLLLLEKRYPYLKIDRYVIMPNHIHAVLILGNRTAGASPRPTVEDIVCAYKSLTTRECKKFGLTNNLFQTSFYEHVIRDQKDYEKIVKYIHENPARWYFDELYSE
ncbi:MAG: transposase [Ruminococcaceae bacterium]|nr:transposase [Oscillospiraceae bacterium]